MSKTEKLRKKLFSKSKEFTYDELKVLMNSYGFEEYTKGKTSGSRVVFVRSSDKMSFYLHKPHPEKTLKAYVIKELIDFINRNNLNEQ